jgi:nucleoside-diphosphate-sugar epimerase
MRILVLGGTTFFGADIVRHSLAAGHAVALFTRGQTRPDFWNRVEHIQGDRADRTAFADRLASERFDAVIDNIAYTAEDVESALDALGGRAGRYVLTSTGAAYRYASGALSPLDEDTVDLDYTPPGYNPADRNWQYAQGKVDAERATRQGSIPWTVIRPPVVLGPYDPTLRGWFYLQRLMDGGPLLLREGGLSSFRLAYSDDLARAYLLALQTEKAIGGTYNICQPEAITLRLLCETAAVALGQPADLVSVPGEVLDRVGLSGGPYAGQVNFLPVIDRAVRDLGYQPTPFKTWLARTVEWYQANSAPDSEGYANRQAELDFATRWRAHIANLTAA